MNKGMRKMYTEDEVVALIKKASAGGEIEVGTKWYFHYIEITVNNAETGDVTGVNGTFLSTKKEEFTHIPYADTGDILLGIYFEKALTPTPQYLMLTSSDDDSYTGLLVNGATGADLITIGVLSYDDVNITDEVTPL